MPPLPIQRTSSRVQSADDVNNPQPPASNRGSHSLSEPTPDTDIADTIKLAEVGSTSALLSQPQNVRASTATSQLAAYKGSVESPATLEPSPVANTKSGSNEEGKPRWKRVWDAVTENKTTTLFMIMIALVGLPPAYKAMVAPEAATAAQLESLKKLLEWQNARLFREDCHRLQEEASALSADCLAALTAGEATQSPHGSLLRRSIDLIQPSKILDLILHTYMSFIFSALLMWGTPISPRFVLRWLLLGLSFARLSHLISPVDFSDTTDLFPYPFPATPLNTTLAYGAVAVICYLGSRLYSNLVFTKRNWFNRAAGSCGVILAAGFVSNHLTFRQVVALATSTFFVLLIIGVNQQTTPNKSTVKTYPKDEIEAGYQEKLSW